VPDREDNVEKPKGDKRRRQETCDGKYERKPQHWTDQPLGNTFQQERRHDQRDQQVLEHVRAKQIVVAQLMQWSLQRHKHNHHCRQEHSDLPTLDALRQSVTTA